MKNTPILGQSSHRWWGKRLGSVRWALALMVVVLSGCDSPGNVVARFHQALVRSDSTKAFSLLCADTKAELERRAQAASAATQGAVSSNPMVMIAQGDPELSKVTEVRQLSVSENRAQVEVKFGQTVQQLSLVRENRAWRISLPMGDSASP